MADAGIKGGPMVVVGAGISGLMTTIELARRGTSVELVSLAPPRHSHSAGVGRGIGAAADEDDRATHLEQTLRDGGDLASRPALQAMVEEAPDIIEYLRRIGVAFEQAGTATARQVLHALDEQVRRFAAEGLVTTHHPTDLLSLVLEEGEAGRCIGVVVQDLTDMATRVIRGNAVCLATGGYGRLFAGSTSSTTCTGAATGIAYAQGAKLANPELIQFHPTCIAPGGTGSDKPRIVNAGARTAGGRLWVPRAGAAKGPPNDMAEEDRFYFMEEEEGEHAAQGNLAPDAVVARTIFRLCRREKLGVDGGDAVYLDVTPLPRCEQAGPLAEVLSAYETVTGSDPCQAPMRVFPALSCTLGGLWVNDAHQTSIAGLYAAGEAAHQYFGAGCSGADSQLACLHGGRRAAEAMHADGRELEKPVSELPERAFDAELARQRKRYETHLAMDGEGKGDGGGENPFRLLDDLRRVMLDAAGIEREEAGLEQGHAELDALRERWSRIAVRDRTGAMNRSVQLTRHLEHMLDLACGVLAGARARTESRGVHARSDCPDRDDEKWLATTIARYGPDGPELAHEPVDVSLAEPRARAAEATVSAPTPPDDDGGEEEER